jgi:anti-sigma regulatory factor (Ser/Thr protein kinase)
MADEGPGIPDIELAMQPGYSTASDAMRDMGFGYGMGLPNIKNNSDGFSLHSEVGKGTRVYSMIRLE